MKNIIYIIVLCLFVGGCTNKPVKQGRASSTENISGVPESLVEIDIDKKYPKKEFRLQEVAEVEYIPLETRADVLLDAGAMLSVYMCDSLIVIYNRNGTIFIFDRGGKIVDVFNRQGKSEREYREIRKMTVDFENREVFIHDYLLRYQILVYSLSGDFKRILKLPRYFQPKIMCDYDKERLLCYDVRDLSMNEGHLSKKPYVLLSKKDGKCVPLDLFLDKRVDSEIVHVLYKAVDSISSSTSGIGILPIMKNGSEVLITDVACDTIYSLKEGKLIPVIVRKPSVINQEPPILFYIYLKTNRYTFMRATEKTQDFHKPSNFFVYDNHTGEISVPCFINTDYTPEKSVKLDNYRVELPENYARWSLSPIKLLEDYQAGRLKGKLKEVASKLHEDDNSVLMLVKFKE